MAYLNHQHFPVNNNRAGRRRVRHQIRRGRRAAAVQAFTAARLYLTKQVSTLAAAAEACGTTVKYTEAAITILMSEDGQLEVDVLLGHVSLLAAAKGVKNTVNLMLALRKANQDEQVAAVRKAGINKMLDVLIAAE
jgi:hypothetical protein